MKKVLGCMVVAAAMTQMVMAEVEDMFSQSFDLAVVTHISKIKESDILISIILQDLSLGERAIRRTVVINTIHNCIYIHR